MTTKVRHRDGSLTLTFDRSFTGRPTGSNGSVTVTSPLAEVLITDIGNRSARDLVHDVDAQSDYWASWRGILLSKAFDGANTVLTFRDIKKHGRGVTFPGDLPFGQKGKGLPAINPPNLRNLGVGELGFPLPADADQPVLGNIRGLGGSHVKNDILVFKTILGPTPAILANTPESFKIAGNDTANFTVGVEYLIQEVIELEDTGAVLMSKARGAIKKFVDLGALELV